MVRIAEAQRIEAGDRPRAHGEHVAQDAADAGGCALIGLDIARVVVALHLEHDGKTVADVDHAGVLARSLDHTSALGRQVAQVHLRGLVRAMLVPHRREDAELGEARLAADQLENALVFLRLEAVFGDQRGSDGRFVGVHCGYVTCAADNFTRWKAGIHVYYSDCHPLTCPAQERTFRRRFCGACPRPAARSPDEASPASGKAFPVRCRSC